MLSDEYTTALLGSVFGDDHSPLLPDVWSLAWLDATGEEITGTGYQRMDIPNDSVTWDVDSVVTNLVDIDGGMPTAGDWPTIHGVALLDTYGATVLSGVLAEPLEPVPSTPVVFEAGELTIGVA